MADVGVFPSLPGLGWSVSKIPTFQTRIQRAVSGRELRAQDYPYPLWQFTLVFNFLRDQWDTRQSGGLGAGLDELRSLMGFYLKCQGAYGTFLFTDPTDSVIYGQPLPAAISMATAIGTGTSAGTAYVVGDIVIVPGGSGLAAPTAEVVTIGGGGAIDTLAIVNPGSLNVVPGTTNLAITGGSGSGANVDVTWLTTTQLQRTMGSALSSGGFSEPITAPNTLLALYYNGISTPAAFVNLGTGVVTLEAAFTGTQPAITADFSYYFRCRFTDDSYTFENFMWQLWQLKKLTFISVLP